MQLSKPQLDDFLIELSQYITGMNGGNELLTLDQYTYVPSIMHFSCPLQSSTWANCRHYNETLLHQAVGEEDRGAARRRRHQTGGTTTQEGQGRLWSHLRIPSDASVSMEGGRTSSSSSSSSLTSHCLLSISGTARSSPGGASRPRQLLGPPGAHRHLLWPGWFCRQCRLSMKTYTS